MSTRTSFSHLTLQKSRDPLMLPQARRRKLVTDVVHYEPLKEAERLQRKDLTTIVTGILWSQVLRPVVVAAIPCHPIARS